MTHEREPQFADIIWQELLMDLLADVRKFTREDIDMCGDSMPRQLIESIVEQAVQIQALCEVGKQERYRLMKTIIERRPAERKWREGRRGIGLCG